jgi:hypothetical protein
VILVIGRCGCASDSVVGMVLLLFFDRMTMLPH